MTGHASAIASAKHEADRIPADRREKLAAEFDVATEKVQRHNEFRQQ
jgi:hypothetical protein